MSRLKQAFRLFLLLIMFSGCSSQSGIRTVTLPPERPTLEATRTTAPSPIPLPTQAPSPTATAIPSPSAVPSQATVSLSATVWTSDPLVPILVYHRFIPLNATNESSTKMALKTFSTELQMLYDAGYTLVPLAAWLKGDLRVPPGRRPVILTMDDLFFADQIFLEADGTPSLRSGLGVLWKFSREHPDFGFSAALFYNLGDKLYANHQVKDWFDVSKGWEDDLAKAIAWCIDHGALPYNHFYTHPRLILMEPPDIVYQLKSNEVRMENLLARIGRQNLAEQSDNLIALPYSRWPDSRGSQKTIMNYTSIDGRPVLGVLEADPHYRARYLLKAPYLDGFNPWHIPRLGTGMDVIKTLTSQVDQFPTAQECVLQVNSDQVDDSQAVAGAIRSAVKTGRCPAGVYALQASLFRVDGETVQPLGIKRPEPK